MIAGYRDKHTERFAAGGFVKRFQSFEQQATKRLAILNAAPSLETLGALPSNRLEALGGGRKGQYSIRINRGNTKGKLGFKEEARKNFETALELARNTNNAKIVTQAEKSLRDLDDAGDS